MKENPEEPYRGSPLCMPSVIVDCARITLIEPAYDERISSSALRHSALADARL
jgi:hypothetical protein